MRASRSTSRPHRRRRVTLFLDPPLLAIAFRPLALLPFDIAAAIWMLVVVASLVGLGLARRSPHPLDVVRTRVACGADRMECGHRPGAGASDVPVNARDAVRSLALAGALKVFPALAAVYWLGRRDWPMLRRFIAWGLAWPPSRSSWSRTGRSLS